MRVLTGWQYTVEDTLLWVSPCLQAALEALDELDLFGAKGGPQSVIRVLGDVPHGMLGWQLGRVKGKSGQGAAPALLSQGDDNPVRS